MDSNLTASMIQNSTKMKFLPIKVYILDTVSECKENLKWVKL